MERPNRRVSGNWVMRRRYMRQGTFDPLVIVRAMADLTEDDRPFFDLVRRYVEMYPSEYAQALVDDVNDAVVTAWKLTKVIVELRPSNSEIEPAWQGGWDSTALFGHADRYSACACRAQGLDTRAMGRTLRWPSIVTGSLSSRRRSRRRLGGPRGSDWTLNSCSRGATAKPAGFHSIGGEHHVDAQGTASLAAQFGFLNCRSKRVAPRN
jgi:hypothetical protein